MELKIRSWSAEGRGLCTYGAEGHIGARRDSASEIDHDDKVHTIKTGATSGLRAHAPGDLRTIVIRNWYEV